MNYYDVMNFSLISQTHLILIRQRYFHYLPSHIIQWKDKLEALGISLCDISTATMENKQKTAIRYGKNSASNSKQNFLHQVIMKEARVVQGARAGFIDLFMSEKEAEQDTIRTLRRRGRDSKHHRCLNNSDVVGDINDWLPTLISRVRDDVMAESGSAIDADSFNVDEIMKLVHDCPFCRDVRDAPARIVKKRRRRNLITRVHIDAITLAEDDDADDEDYSPDQEDEATEMNVDNSDSDTDDNDEDSDSEDGDSDDYVDDE